MDNSEITVQSLAVKYRPTSILGLVGQDTVSKQLRGMIKSKRFPAAILLSGESGTGKTTTARVLYRTINCKNLNPDNFMPCGECQPCKMGDASPDLTEVNIGDTRGIDDIRALCQSARSMPIIGSKRVIILDEVHNLLAAGSTALLKSLEDSPPRTMWILATTNPEKLLPTIVGRCLKLNMTIVEPEIMAKRLRIIAKREGVNLMELDGGEEIIQLIVELSSGRLRDAISILESALFSIKGSDDVDAKVVLNKFKKTGDAELEKLAAEMLIALMICDVKSVVRVSRTTSSCRGILQKLRWLVQYSLDNIVGIAQYKPYSSRVFSDEAKKLDLKLNIHFLVKLQYLLVGVETQLNTLSIDESVLFQSALASFAVENKK